MSVEVKICGLTNLEDAQVALESGADYLGFVTYAPSKRSISIEALQALRAELPTDARCIGVFVNETRDDVLRAAERCNLYAVQIHGDESASHFTHMPLPVWRAIAVSEKGFSPDPSQWPATRYVADAAVPGEYGGTGESADWTLSAELSRHVPLMLAGGLNSDNVAAAIAQVQPAGVDVASGVEAEPGRKNHSELTAFIRNAKNG